MLQFPLISASTGVSIRYCFPGALVVLSSSCVLGRAGAVDLTTSNPKGRPINLYIGTNSKEFLPRSMSITPRPSEQRHGDAWYQGHM